MLVGKPQPAADHTSTDWDLHVPTSRRCSYSLPTECRDYNKAERRLLFMCLMLCFFLCFFFVGLVFFSKGTRVVEIIRAEREVGVTREVSRLT